MSWTENDNELFKDCTFAADATKRNYPSLSPAEKATWLIAFAGFVIGFITGNIVGIAHLALHLAR